MHEEESSIEVLEGRLSVFFVVSPAIVVLKVCPHPPTALRSPPKPRLWRSACLDALGKAALLPPPPPSPPSQPLRVVCKSLVGIFTHCMQVFARLAPICMLRWCLLTKISASELSQMFIMSALLVGFLVATRPPPPPLP